MDFSDLSSSLAVSKIASQGSILVARKSLNLQKQQGQNAIALIQAAIPDLGDGKGKLVNSYV